MNFLYMKTVEYFWIKGVQKITNLGWPLVSKFGMLTGNLSDYKYKNIWRNIEEYLNTLSVGNMIN